MTNRNSNLDRVIYDPSIVELDTMPVENPPMDNVMPSFEGLEDPKVLEDYQQMELADGGVVEREGFDKGTDPRYFKGKVAEEITDAFIKAFQKDDISVLFNKTKANPDGILSQTASESINNKLIKNPKGIQSLVDATELDADTIYDMLDERDAFRDLDTRQVTMKNISAVGDSTKEVLNEGEKWLIKNSKKYNNVNNLKKGFKRVFTKDHPFFQKQFTFSEGTLDNFGKLFFSNITKSFASGYDDKGSPIGRYKISGKSTEDIFNASLYNFNPQVKNKVLNELKDLTSQDINKGSRTSLKKRLMSNKILSDLGINRNLTGPIARLLLKDINEDVLANLRNIKSRGYVIDELKYLKQLVDPKYKDQFDLVGKAIREAGRNKYEGAKQTLKIAENINYDHKIPQSIIDLGYADEIEYAKLNPIGEEFNKKIKNHEFDSKISRLIRNYEATPVKDRGKIVKEMNNLKKTFNKKYNNYLGDVSIKEINGKLNFSSSAKLITTPEGVTEQLTKNVKKNPGLFKINQQKLFSKIPGITDLFEMAGSIPDDFKKAKYLSSGLKTLGVVAAPVVIYDLYSAFKEGKPLLEVLEQGFVGTDVIGGTKRLISLSPKGKEARAVVKKAEMDDQIAQDDTFLDTDLGMLPVESDLTLEEAEKKYKEEAKKVSEQEALQNKQRGKNRFSLYTLEPPKPVEDIMTQYLSYGGRVEND